MHTQCRNKAIFESEMLRTSSFGVFSGWGQIDVDIAFKQVEGWRFGSTWAAYNWALIRYKNVLNASCALTWRCTSLFILRLCIKSAMQWMQFSDLSALPWQICQIKHALFLGSFYSMASKYCPPRLGTYSQKGSLSKDRRLAWLNSDLIGYKNIAMWQCLAFLILQTCWLLNMRDYNSAYASVNSPMTFVCCVEVSMGNCNISRKRVSYEEKLLSVWYSLVWCSIHLTHFICRHSDYDVTSSSKYSVVLPPTVTAGKHVKSVSFIGTFNWCDDNQSFLLVSMIYARRRCIMNHYETSECVPKNLQMSKPQHKIANGLLWYTCLSRNWFTRTLFESWVFNKTFNGK